MITSGRFTDSILVMPMTDTLARHQRWQRSCFVSLPSRSLVSSTPSAGPDGHYRAGRPLHDAESEHQWTGVGVFCFKNELIDRLCHFCASVTGRKQAAAANLASGASHAEVGKPNQPKFSIS